MDERERNNKISPEIFVYATNKNFLNVYDALRIEKVKIEIAGYDSATNKQTGIASAWLDVDDLRLMIHLVTNRQFKDVLDRGRFERFGGSEREGVIESRTILLEWDPGDNNRFARFPYRLTIANGPGTRTPNGAVQPNGEPTNKLSMRLPEPDMMKIMLAVGAYVAAYESENHDRMVSQKVRDLQQKLSERNQRPLAVGFDEPAPARPQPRPAAAPIAPVASAREQRPAPTVNAPVQRAASDANLRVVGRQEAPQPAPRPTPGATRSQEQINKPVETSRTEPPVRPTRPAAPQAAYRGRERSANNDSEPLF